MTKLSQKQQTFVKICIITLAFGLFAHAYRFFNASFSHDSLFIFQPVNSEDQISYGRFLIPIYVALRSTICSPSLIGFISLLWLSVAIFIISDILNIKSTPALICICGILSTNIAITASFATYIPWVDIYMLALVFSFVAVYIFRKYKYGFLFAALPLLVSMGLYPIYFSAAVVMFLILLTKKIFEKEKTSAVIISGLKMLCSLMLGLVLYYFAVRIAWHFTGVAPSDDYNGVAGAGNFSDISSLLSLLINTYVYPFKILRWQPICNSRYVALLNIVILAITAYNVIKIILCQKIHLKNILLLIVVMLLLPLGMNIAMFIAKGYVHHLMIYSFFLTYVLVVFTFEFIHQNNLSLQSLSSTAALKRIMPSPESKLFKSNLGEKIVFVAIALLIFNNIVFANQTYLKKDLEFTATASVMTRCLDRIEQTEGYIPGETPVAFIGDINKSALIETRPGYLHNMTGLYSSYSITYFDSYELYLTNVLGYNINCIPKSIYTDIESLDEVVAMPSFPDKDSVKIINGILVVKLS